MAASVSALSWWLKFKSQSHRLTLVLPLYETNLLNSFSLPLPPSLHLSLSLKALCCRVKVVVICGRAAIGVNGATWRAWHLSVPASSPSSIFIETFLFQGLPDPGTISMLAQRQEEQPLGILEWSGGHLSVGVGWLCQQIGSACTLAQSMEETEQIGLGNPRDLHLGTDMKREEKSRCSGEVLQINIQLARLAGFPFYHCDKWRMGLSLTCPLCPWCLPAPPR